MTDPLGTQASSRRNFLVRASGAIAAAGLASSALTQEAKPTQQNDVQLSQIHATTEQPEKIPGPFELQPQRTGFAIVGLGRLALGEILPAMAKTKYCKPVALVSGDRDKARKSPRSTASANRPSTTTPATSSWRRTPRCRRSTSCCPTPCTRILSFAAPS